MTSKKDTSKSSGKSAKSAEPQTMEELLAEFGGGVYSFSLGDRVRGKVVGKEQGKLILNIGGKTEGLVAGSAYQEAEDFIATLKEGDEVEGTVIVTETPDGYTVLSLRAAVQNSAWREIEDARDKGKPIKVFGKRVNPSGVTVEVKKMMGFIPSSQLSKVALRNPQNLVSKSFEAIVIDLDRASRKIVLSEKEVSEKEDLAKAREAIKNISEGDVFEGKVLSIYDFGCFVEIKAPIDGEKKLAKGRSSSGREEVPLEGLVHISEISWDKVDNPSQEVSEGDWIKVKVIGKRNDKLAFSIKQTQKDPWEDVEKKYKKESRAKGKVVKISDFGVFVRLEPGVEGLIHITKIPPEKKIREGDNVNVLIEEIDPKEKRISLGLVLTEKPIGYK